jgi:Uma2 family endonuclease
MTRTLNNISDSPIRVSGMSFKEFLRKYDSQHAEWVNGEAVMMAAVSNVHADLAGFLQGILRHYAEAHHAGEVLAEPFVMKTGAKLPGRSPDILFIAGKNRNRLKKTYLEGPADLVVEIISPESRVTDRGEKYYEYEQGGVREYWLLDPLRKKAEFYQLGRDGTYQLAEVEQGIYRSLVLKGLWIEVTWLWQRPLPPMLSIVKKWGLI